MADYEGVDVTILEPKHRSRFVTCPTCKRRLWRDGASDIGKCIACWRKLLRGPTRLELGHHINVCERCGARDWAIEERPLCAICTQVPQRWKESGVRKCQACAEPFRPVKRNDARCVDCINVRNRWMIEARARGTHTTQEWLDLVADHAGLCAYCGVAPGTSKDHIRPVSRGGSDSIANIAPACTSCNSSKGNRLLGEWTRQMVA